MPIEDKNKDSGCLLIVAVIIAAAFMGFLIDTCQSALKDFAKQKHIQDSIRAEKPKQVVPAQKTVWLQPQIRSR